jgi:hypothetical protein
LLKGGVIFQEGYERKRLEKEEQMKNNHGVEKGSTKLTRPVPAQDSKKLISNRRK